MHREQFGTVASGMILALDAIVKALPEKRRRP
jgi:hypothetical protein